MEALPVGTSTASDPFLRIRDVQVDTGLSRSAIYRRMAAGTFPRPQQLAGGVVRWRRSKIDAWKEAQPEAGGAMPPVPAQGAAPEPPPTRRRPGRPRAS
ncbi:helix-turn-helix transcriptional regulator [Roseomonas sp. SXEYE001]|nr:AlpA family phage regulatory protein [Roseomonas sp. SXEYE001]